VSETSWIEVARGLRPLIETHAHSDAAPLAFHVVHHHVEWARGFMSRAAPSSS
jgi:hypothetical protein